MSADRSGEEKTYDKNELLRAFSMALDLAERQPLNHAARTAYVALQTARALGLPEIEVENVYIAAFLHDLGAKEMACDIATGKKILENHEETGRYLMSLMPFTSRAGDYIILHRPEQEYEKIMKTDFPLGAQIVQLADEFDLQFDRTRFYFDQLEEIKTWLKEKHALYAKDVTKALTDLVSREKFWLDFTSSGIELILKDIQPNLTARLTRSEVEQIANVFAAIIDSKSTYTYHHSRGVAEIMERLAPLFLHTDEEIFQLRVAALLHDLGKLAVPEEILDKPGKLSTREFEMIKAHPYYTKVILGRVKGFELIKEWAGNHHETIDGWGYPEHKTELSIPERLMAVADVYQALTEERPYRRPMTSQEAIKAMREMVHQQKLCVAGVALIQKVI